MLPNKVTDLHFIWSDPFILVLDKDIWSDPFILVLDKDPHLPDGKKGFVAFQFSLLLTFFITFDTTITVHSHMTVT